MAIKNIILKGISRVPDDSAASVTTRSGAMVSEMQMAVNMANDGAGLTLIEKPDTIFPLGVGEDCVFIHQTSEYKHYITVVTATSETVTTRVMYWCKDGEFARKELYTLQGELKTINAVGNTLILDDGAGVRYIVFKNDEVDDTEKYVDLGQKPQFTEIKFGIESEFTYYPEGSSDAEYNRDISRYGFNDKQDSSTFEKYCLPSTKGFRVNIEKYTPDEVLKTYREMYVDQVFWKGCNLDIEDASYNGETSGVDTITNEMSNSFMGYMNKFIAKATKDNKFVFPFFVRYAYDMFDGSQIMHSYPVLLIPNSRGPIFAIDRQGWYINDDEINVCGKMLGFYGSLEHIFLSIPEGLENWKDIVKGISIYATAPVYTYDQSGKVYGWHNMEWGNDIGITDDPWADYYTTGKISNTAFNYGKNSLYDVLTSDDKFYQNLNNTGDTYPHWIVSLPEKNITEIRENLHSAGQFYKIKEYTTEDLIKIKNGTYSGVTVGDVSKVSIDDDVLNTLVNRIQMQDDYHSHDTLFTDCTYSYNKRINLGGVTRKLHSPISLDTQFGFMNDDERWNCNEAVYIHNSEHSDIVVGDTSALYCKCFPQYIFYPNVNAYKIYLLYKSQKYEIKLKEHPNLEGAYWCTNLWGTDEDITLLGDVDAPTATSGIVYEKGKVYTSNVENPFTFVASNINQIGDGEIRALCANTQAVNAYNFGYATMYAFTSEGVWGLKVNDSGGFQAIQPITRDVITAGTKPVALGQHIIFLANKGVMRIDINSSLTKCISNGLHGYVGGNYPSVSAILDAVLTSEVADNLKFALNLDDSSEFFWLNGETKMVYDYRNNRVLFSDGNGAWVYNMKSETWTQTQTSVNTALNAWPECEFVEGGNVVTMDGVQSKYSYGALLTRPIATGSEWYSRLKQVFAKGNFSVHSNDVELALYGCRNYSDYSLVASSTCGRITRHFGSGFKEHAILAVVDILHGKSSDDEDKQDQINSEREKQSNIFSLDRFDVDIEGDEQDKLR